MCESQKIEQKFQSKQNDDVSPPIYLEKIDTGTKVTQKKVSGLGLLFWMEMITDLSKPNEALK